MMRVFLSTCLLACLPIATVQADDWPHWRGPQRNDVSREPSGWERGAWPPGEPVWVGKVGAGASAPVVVGERLYVLGSADGRDTVRCLEAASGRELWNQSYACPEYGRHSYGDQGLYSGSSASPEYDPETGCLVTLSVDGDLCCWDTQRKGREVWRLNFYDAYQVGQRPIVGPRRQLRDYGYTTAPLVYGPWVIAEVGDDEGNLMAFDKRTGKRAWVSESKDPAGHTGGLAPITVGGVPCVAVLTIRNLLVVRLDSGHEGETVAQHEWVTSFANNIATPAVHGDEVIVTSEYNRYAICKLKISLAGARKVWEHPYPSGVCTPIIHKGHVYWCWRGVHCLDFATGELCFRGGAFGETGSCIVTADDRLIVWADHGELVLVETAERSPDKYQELARLDGVFKRDVWPHVVLSAGRLFCKDRDGNLKCFRL